MTAKKKTTKKKATAAKKKTTKKKTGANKKATKKKTGAKKTSPKKTTGAKKPAKREGAPAAKAPAARGAATASDVNLGHVFALRPRVNASFSPEHLRRAKDALAEERFASLPEAARAVAEKALDLTRGDARPGRR